MNTNTAPRRPRVEDFENPYPPGSVEAGAFRFGVGDAIDRIAGAGLHLDDEMDDDEEAAYAAGEDAVLAFYDEAGR